MVEDGGDVGTFWWRSVVLWSREAREVMAEVRRGWERRQEARGEVASCWDSWQGGLGVLLTGVAVGGGAVTQSVPSVVLVVLGVTLHVALSPPGEAGHGGPQVAGQAVLRVEALQQGVHRQPGHLHLRRHDHVGERLEVPVVLPVADVADPDVLLADGDQLPALEGHS